MARCLIVGGSDAGISAALRIRELDPTLEVAVLLRDAGARPVLPSLPGIDRLGVFPFRSMGDGLRLQSFLELRRPRRAVIVGGGYISLEMVEALSERGMEVTLLERNKALLATVHPSLAGLVAQDLRSRGVHLLTGVTVTAIEEEAGSLGVLGDPHFAVQTDLVLLAVGVTPETDLARSCRLPVGAQLLGPFPQEVSKRLDVLANALFHGMTMETLSDLDLSCTPPLSSPWDPLQMAAQHWCRTVATGAEGG